MTEEEWRREKNIFEMFLFLEDKRYARKWDLFCCHCLCRVWSILPDGRIRAYVDVIERRAEGKANEEEFETAWSDCEAAFEAGGDAFPYNWFRSAFTEYRAQLDPYDVARTCREAVGVVVAESLRPAPTAWTEEMTRKGNAAEQQEEDAQVRLVDDIFGNPFRPVTLDPEWFTSTVVALAEDMYKSRDFSSMPILADALQDAGCENDDILNHCREPGTHVRGCWVVDLILGKT